MNIYYNYNLSFNWQTEKKNFSGQTSPVQPKKNSLKKFLKQIDKNI